MASVGCMRYDCESNDRRGSCTLKEIELDEEGTCGDYAESSESIAEKLQCQAEDEAERRREERVGK